MGNRYTLSSHEELFKEFYIPLAEAAVNMSTPLRAMMKRIKNFTGKEIKGVVRLSVGGGGGNNVIPVSSTRKSEPIDYTPEALWQSCTLDWQAMVSSGDDKGAFVNITVDEVEGAMQNFTRNEERQFFGTSTGALGTINTVATVDNGDGTWTMVISAATWFKPNWEEGDVINVGTAVDQFEITDVDRDAREVTYERRSGSTDPTTFSTTAIIYKQGSKDHELCGLKQIADATVGVTELYGLIARDRYKARLQDAGSKPLIPDMLTDICAYQEEETGKQYSAVILNACQYASLSNQLEGKKEYTQIKSKDSRYADMGWKALTFQADGQELTIIKALFCPKDRAYLITRDQMEVRERPKFGWLDFDGKNKFLRHFMEGSVPMYKALYGGYEQFFHHPAYLGCIHTLEVPASA